MESSARSFLSNLQGVPVTCRTMSSAKLAILLFMVAQLINTTLNQNDTSITEKKSCSGVEMLHSGNIKTFIGCTVVEGSVVILDTTFSGFQEVYHNFTFGKRYSQMNPRELEALSSLREIKGYLSIQASHDDFRDLSCFRNLEVIHGRQLTEYFSALYIVKTSLHKLKLRSLQTIHSGSVAILENPNMCFVNKVNWKHFMSSTSKNIILQRNGSPKLCDKMNLACDSQCSTDGCWDTGPDECLSCKASKLRNTCVQDCDTTEGVYLGENSICELCHEECLGCIGPGSGNCTQCRNVKDGPYCVRLCPESKYVENGECKPCDVDCADGCTGPGNTVGLGGCNSCEKGLLEARDSKVIKCLQADKPCPDGYNEDFIGLHEEGIMEPLRGKPVCWKCIYTCQNWTAYGFSAMVCDCQWFRSDEQNEESCPADYHSENNNFDIVICAEGCKEYFKETSTERKACKSYRVYMGNNNTLLSSISVSSLRFNFNMSTN